MYTCYIPYSDTEDDATCFRVLFFLSFCSGFHVYFIVVIMIISIELIVVLFVRRQFKFMLCFTENE